MAKRKGRTNPCTPKTRAGRLRKAEQFLDQAELAGEDASDTCVSLCVLAGIAAADVICCVRLGVHASGDNHQQAVVLLTSADKSQAGHLNRLLTQKSRASYSDLQATPAQARQALRSARAMVQAAVSIA